MKKSLAFSLAMLVSFTALTGCTTISSGMRVGELPNSENQVPTTFTAANGMTFSVSEVNANNIPTATTLRKVVNLPPLSRGVGDYRIAAGDVLNIYLPSFPEFIPTGQSLLVSQNGYLQFPMIGQIKASGLTTVQLTNVLTSRLSKYLKQPDPQVSVTTYRGNKFYIDGKVKTPGQFPLADQPISLYSALGLAGGIDSTGDSENITLIRAGQTYHFGLKSMEQLGYSPNNLMLRDGDVIRVGSSAENKVIMMGEFMRPTPVKIPDEGITLASVIGEVSGVDGRSANARKIYVLREDSNQQRSNIYVLDLSTITNVSVANRFKMQAGDVVYVDPTGLVRWNRVISMLLPTSSLGSVIANQF